MINSKITKITFTFLSALLLFLAAGLFCISSAVDIPSSGYSDAKDKFEKSTYNSHTYAATNAKSGGKTTQYYGTRLIWVSSESGYTTSRSSGISAVTGTVKPSRSSDVVLDGSKNIIWKRPFSNDNDFGDIKFKKMRIYDPYDSHADKSGSWRGYVSVDMNMHIGKGTNNNANNTTNACKDNAYISVSKTVSGFPQVTIFNIGFIGVGYNYYYSGTNTAYKISGSATYKDIDAGQGLGFKHPDTTRKTTVVSANSILKYKKADDIYWFPSGSEKALSATPNTALGYTFGDEKTETIYYVSNQRSGDKLDLGHPNGAWSTFLTAKTSMLAFEPMEPIKTVSKTKTGAEEATSSVGVTKETSDNTYTLSDLTDKMYVRVDQSIPIGMYEGEYKSFKITDTLNKYLKIDGTPEVVASRQSNGGKYFSVTTSTNSTGETTVTAKLSKPGESGFYHSNTGDVYTLIIPVKLNTDMIDELLKDTNCCKEGESGDYEITISNNAVSEITSNAFKDISISNTLKKNTGNVFLKYLCSPSKLKIKKTISGDSTETKAGYKFRLESPYTNEPLYATTDENGIAEFSQTLYNGTYTVSEELTDAQMQKGVSFNDWAVDTGISGFSVNSSGKITIPYSDAGLSTNVIEAKNKKEKGNLEIINTLSSKAAASDTGAGYQFTIEFWNSAKNEYQLIDTKTTELYQTDKGRIILNNVGVGKYRVTEKMNDEQSAVYTVDSPSTGDAEGTVTNGGTTTLNFSNKRDANAKIKVKITKEVTGENGSPSGFSLKMEGNNGYESYATTDTNGEAVFQIYQADSDNSDVEYTITEELKDWQTANGWEFRKFESSDLSLTKGSGEGEYKFTVDSSTSIETKNITLTNHYDSPKTVRVKLSIAEKAETTDKPSDYEFSIYKTDKDNPSASVMSDWTKISTLKTDSAGTAMLEGLKSGKYLVVEELDSSIYKILTPESGKRIITLNTENPDVTAEFVNTAIAGWFQATKTSDDDRISDIEFQAERTETSEVYTFTSDENGIIKGKLPKGNYTLTESDPAYVNSYVVSPSNGYSFEITGSETEANPLKKDSHNTTMEFVNTVYSVKLTKYETNRNGNLVNPGKLAGAEFTLYKEVEGFADDIICGDYTTSSLDESLGEINISGLEKGNYYFMENKAESISSHYSIDTEKRYGFTVGDATPKAEVTVRNVRKQGKILVYKTDDEGEFVGGATIGIYSDSSCTDLIQDAVTETDKDSGEYGTVTFDSLEWGTYYIKETRAPNGFAKNDTVQSVTINTESKTMTKEVTIENTRIGGSVELTKRAAENKSIVLPGATYSLFKDDGTEVKSGLVTDSNGKILIEDLEWGKYYFVETDAPTGYSINSSHATFSITKTQNGMTKTVTAYDKQGTVAVKVHKKIKSAEFYAPHGKLSFTFKLVGKTSAGTVSTLYRSVSFKSTGDNKINNQSTSNEYVTSTVVFGDLPSVDNGKQITYHLTEEPSLRYKLSGYESITNGSKNGSAEVEFALSAGQTGEATAVNTKADWKEYSEGDMQVASLEKDPECTGILIEYSGDPMDPGEVFNIDNLTVTAEYSNGETKELDESEYSLTYNGETFTRIPSDATPGGSISVDVQHGNFSNQFDIDVRNQKNVTVRFDYNDNDSGKACIPALSGNSIRMLRGKSLADYESENHLELDAKWDGKFFGGWYKDADLTQPCDKEDVINESMKVYASWSSTAFTLTTVVTPEGGGTVSEPVRDSDFPNKVTVTATKNSGYVFSHWANTATGSPISTADTLTLRLTEDRTVYAVFMEPSKTTLFSDGTLIINEANANRSTNITEHGAVVEEWQGFLPDGETELQKYVFSSADNQPWKNRRSSIKSVEIGSIITVPSTAYWFTGLTSLESVNLTNLVTSGTTSMKAMFSGCSSLKTMNISNLDTVSVTDFSEMFKNARTHFGSWTIDVSVLNTSSAATFGSMFESINLNGGDGITGLDSFDTSHATDFSRMFYGYTGNSLDLSSFNMSSAANTSNMFYNAQCSKIYGGTGFVLPSGCTASNMFTNASSLTGGNGTKYNSGHINGQYAFCDCYEQKGYLTYKAASSLENPARTLSYDLNNGTGDTITQTVAKGKHFTCQGADSNMANPAKTARHFIGWSTEKEASEAQYVAGDDVPAGNANVTLYAVWARKIEYKANRIDEYGNALPDTVSISGIPSDGYASGVSETVPTISDGNYVFLGWANASRADAGSDGWYDPGNTVGETDSAGHSVGATETLYAQWYNVGKLEEEITGSVRSGDTKSKAYSFTSQTISSGDTATFTKTFTPDDGYKFFPRAVTGFKLNAKQLAPFRVYNSSGGTETSIQTLNDGSVSVSPTPSVYLVEVLERTGESYPDATIENRITNLQNISDACLKTNSYQRASFVSSAKSIATRGQTQYSLSASKSGYRPIGVSGYSLSGAGVTFMNVNNVYLNGTSLEGVISNMGNDAYSITMTIDGLYEEIKTAGTRTTPSYGTYTTYAERRAYALSDLNSKNDDFFKYSDIKAVVVGDSKLVNRWSIETQGTISLYGVDICHSGDSTPYNNVIPLAAGYYAENGTSGEKCSRAQVLTIRTSRGKRDLAVSSNFMYSNTKNIWVRSYPTYMNFYVYANYIDK